MASDNGIDVKISADTRDFEDNVKDAAEALEKIADNLDDVGTGSKDVDKVEKSISDLNKTAMQADDKLGRTFGKNFRKNTGDAKGGLTELKDEASQTARETAASFDGTATSIVDMFQEVAANAFRGFGPAGAAAGLAAAAGIGVVVNAIQLADASAKESQKRISDLASELINVGGVGQRDLGVVDEKLKDIYTGADGAAKKLTDVAKASKQTGIEAAIIARAYAGDETAINQVSGAIDRAINKNNELGRAAKTAGGARIYLQQVADLQKYQEELKRTQDELHSAQNIEQQFLQANADAYATKQGLIEQINGAYDQTVGSIKNYVDSETGVLDVDAFVAAIKAKETALLDYQANIAKANLTPEQIKALNDMGAENAALYVDALVNGTAENSKYLRDSLTKAASDSSSAAADVIGAAFAEPTDASVIVKVDEASLQGAREAIQNGLYNQTYKIKIQAYDRAGRQID
jgi:hypothetical protein